MNESLVLQIITGSVIALGAGYVGSFMVIRRMSLVGDALSHVALPGIALAILFNINPFFGAFTALLLAIVGIWFLEKRTELPSETLVGIFFTVSLALGLLLTPEPELLEALFGDITTITFTDMYISIFLVSLIMLAIYEMKNALTLTVISRELAMASRISVSRINFIFFLLVAVVVALGLKVAGTLLMGSLVIIPAAAAKNISVNLGQYSWLSVIFSVASAVTGLFIAQFFGILAGPTIVLTAGFIFLLTLFAKRIA